jgi:RNA polymerase sigma-70 factor, ECF subfamily
MDAKAAPAERDYDLSFEREALPWLDDVYRFALSLTRNEADADDIVQETYLRAYRSWHTFERGSDARRWLFTICRNAFLRTRERSRHQVDLEEGDVEALASQVAESAASQPDDDRLLTRLDLGPALSRAMERLAEPFRSTVTLVDVEDQSYEAASDILGVPIGTVRSRLFRGRRLLQQMLTEYARDAGIAPPAVSTATPHATPHRNP